MCVSCILDFYNFFFFQAEDGIRDSSVTGVQTCALPISLARTSGTSSSAESTPRSRPAAIARQASVASWQVNALVEATPTSGPASVGNTISLARAIVELGTLTTEKDALPMSFGEFQRGERVGGLSGLRYKDRQIAGIERHVAVAKFGRDIDFHREPCVTFEPVPGNQPGLKAGATGLDRQSIDIPKIQFHDFRYVDRAAGDINVWCERLADYPRLFVNLFDHKVPMLAFLDEYGRTGEFGWRASHVFALRIEKVDSLPPDDGDGTIFQVADQVRKVRKSNRVRPKVHFASAVLDRKWRSFARSNYQVFVPFEQERKCKRSFQPR